jgi:hypothetical protein
MTDIRTDVPMDIHPGVLLEHQDTLGIPETMGPAVLHSGHAALSTIYETIGKLNDANAAWEATAPKKVVMKGSVPTATSLPSPELISAAERAFATSAKFVDTHVQGLNRSIGAIETLVTNAVMGTSLTPLAAEIRSHVKSVKDSEARLAFIHGLVHEGKQQDVAAILAAPSYLSGLTDAQKETLREAAAHKFAPVAAKQLRAAREVASRVERASGILITAFSKVIAKRDTPAAKATNAIKALG